ncbi:MAG: ATP-binding protein, partial [Thermoanaerobaculia bacterium]
QGRILAAALGGRGEIQGGEAEQILANMQQQLDARLRVYDRDFQVLADSSLLGPRSDGAGDAPARPATGAERETRDSLLYRLGTLLYGLYARVFVPPEPPLPDSELDATVEEIRAKVLRGALEGRYRAGAAVSPERRSLTLYSAIPIRDGEEVVGVALASKSTFQILQDLYDLRLSTFKVVLMSVAAAILLSLVVATTIARPLHRLRLQAKAILDRRGRLKGGFQGSRRRDEIGDLSRALAELTRRLRRHIGFIESFASDVSHEFKNPLATIRTATELLAEVDDPGERQRFIAMILDDIARLEHLLSEVREITQIDATLEDQPVEPVDLDQLLRAFVERYEMQSAGQVKYRSAVAGTPPTVTADPERLARVFENLLDNATSFSPAGGEVLIELTTGRGDTVITLRDQGPGIPEEHLERIFDRFFSYRQAGDGHTGLGLAIVKTIVEGCGGRVTAANAEGGGAVFEVRLPRD